MIDLYPNETLPLMWVIFAVAFVMLSRFVFKPSLKLVEQRKKQTAELKDKSVLLLEEAGKKLARYESAINQTRQKAADEREKIIRTAREEERAIIEKTRAENEAVLAEIKRNIEIEKNRAMDRLKSMAGVLGREIAGKILERATT